jgi:hypothetical protein
MAWPVKPVAISVIATLAAGSHALDHDRTLVLGHHPADQIKLLHVIQPYLSILIYLSVLAKQG